MVEGQDMLENLSGEGERSYDNHADKKCQSNCYTG